MISIVAKIPLGTNIEQAFAETIKLSDKLDVKVEFVFNDKLWHVIPGDEVDVLTSNYYYTMAQRKWDDHPMRTETIPWEKT